MTAIPVCSHAPMLLNAQSAVNKNNESAYISLFNELLYVSEIMYYNQRYRIHNLPRKEVHTMNSIWRERTFVSFLCGQTLAQFGAAIATFAIPWLLLQKPGPQPARGSLLLSASSLICCFLCRRARGQTG
ncbi:hypothetical protein [Gordoniibacillus kamchatkensis]|uniref:hypothetical protein n=1 Tax=Gordoniibacillus kamchatkensis TaxID=1590651 RepID=UPI001E35A9D4|nr:hypothetical protein [Paenibacillus sp. VKM B-2647]